MHNQQSHLAAPRTRLYARLIDMILPVLSVAGYASVFASLFFEVTSPSIQLALGSLIVVQIVASLLQFVKLIFDIILLVRRSQTTGKFLFNIRTVHEKTGAGIGFWRYALLRGFVGQQLIPLSIVIFSGGFIVGISRIASFVAVPLIFIIYFVIDSLLVLRQDRRALHDMIAGTAVVVLPEEKKRKGFFDFSNL